MGLHQFGLGWHTSANWKVPKARADQHQVIADSVAAPSLEESATLTAPDWVYFLANLAMAHGAHTRLRVVLDTLLGREHSTAQAMRYINE